MTKEISSCQQQYISRTCRPHGRRALPQKCQPSLTSSNRANVFTPNDLVAVKLHFGESGNMGFIRPQYVKKVVERLLELKSKPFLTDTNTLYVGSRSQAHSHLITAFDNGFTREITRAPAIIADGLRGSNASPHPLFRAPRYPGLRCCGHCQC